MRPCVRYLMAAANLLAARPQEVSSPATMDILNSGLNCAASGSAGKRPAVTMRRKAAYFMATSSCSMRLHINTPAPLRAPKRVVCLWGQNRHGVVADARLCSQRIKFAPPSGVRISNRRASMRRPYGRQPDHQRTQPFMLVCARGFDPMQITETRAISLQAPQDVKLSAGLTLAPGLYQGTEERIRTDSIAGPSWTIKYKITLTKEQLYSPPFYANIEVTEFVRQGRLTICAPA